MQDPDTIYISPIEEHLHRLELIEKKRSRRRFLVGGILVAIVLAFGLLIFSQMSSAGGRKTYVIVPAEKFDHPETKEMVVKGKSAIILTDFETGSKDTIFNLTSYRRWIKEYGAAYSFTKSESKERVLLNLLIMKRRIRVKLMLRLPLMTLHNPQ